MNQSPAVDSRDSHTQSVLGIWDRCLYTMSVVSSLQSGPVESWPRSILEWGDSLTLHPCLQSLAHLATPKISPGLLMMANFKLDPLHMTGYKPNLPVYAHSLFMFWRRMNGRFAASINNKRSAIKTSPVPFLLLSWHFRDAPKSIYYSKLYRWAVPLMFLHPCI